MLSYSSFSFSLSAFASLSQQKIHSSCCFLVTFGFLNLPIAKSCSTKIKAQEIYSVKIDSNGRKGSTTGAIDYTQPLHTFSAIPFPCRNQKNNRTLYLQRAF